ncbi:unnamed protein product [Closterium sp. NIES-65]|nr:unnamed protein product [Closterium sp. NIES-65]
MAARLRGYTAARLRGYTAARLCGYSADRLRWHLFSCGKGRGKGVEVLVRGEGRQLKGALAYPLGALAYPSGALAYPSGALAYPSGALAYPSGALAYPSGALAYPSGALAYPSGALAYPSGALAYPSGALAYPSGAPTIVVQHLRLLGETDCTLHHSQVRAQAGASTGSGALATAHLLPSVTHSPFALTGPPSLRTPLASHILLPLPSFTPRILSLSTHCPPPVRSAVARDTALAAAAIYAHMFPRLPSSAHAHSPPDLAPGVEARGDEQQGRDEDGVVATFQVLWFLTPCHFISHATTTQPFGFVFNAAVHSEFSTCPSLPSHMHSPPTPLSFQSLPAFLRGDSSMLKYSNLHPPTPSPPHYVQVIFMAGWAPHESQQRARPRGSAAVSLHALHHSLPAYP